VIALLGIGLPVLGQIGALPKKDFSLGDYRDPELKPGDVWQYKTRDGEASSLLTILKTEKSAELGEIVHVAVKGLKIRNCDGRVQFEELPHMPFARNALKESLVRKVKSGRVPDFKRGYSEWRDGYILMRAGIYIVSVADAVSANEQTFLRGTGCTKGYRTNPN